MPKKIQVIPLVGMLSVCAAMSGAFGAPVALAQTAILSNEDLKAAGTAARAFVPKDQFESPPLGPDWVGRKFSYVIEPRAFPRGNGAVACAGFPDWSYVGRTFTVSVNAAYITSYEFMGSNGAWFPGAMSPLSRNGLNISSIECDRVEESTSMASNAFGAQFSVRRWTDRVIGIADTDEPDFKFHQYWKTEIDGDAARRISRGIRARISGTLSTWPGGQTVVCGSNRRGATVSSPVDRTIDACIFHGRIETIEFFDAQTGQVYYSATRNQKKSSRR